MVIMANNYQLLTTGNWKLTTVVWPLTPGPWPLTCTNSYVRKNKVNMQNEPNFPESQMNVTKLLTRDYGNKTLSGSGKNEPKTNPNKANSRKTQNERK